jgi:hypothetical protein
LCGHGIPFSAYCLMSKGADLAYAPPAEPPR